MIGRTLSHFRILEKLGSGGMGEVYAAEDTELDRKVALKILPPELGGSEERRARFKREAKAVAALNHPNIVTVHSIEEAEGIHFITMELVRGKTLRELIPDKGMALGKFFDIAIPMADALSAAHQRGITHRDLKPENVMMSDEARLKILDFGLAKLKLPLAGSAFSKLPTQSATHQGHIVGTTAYMSPEQAEGKTVDHRTDIFSLGIILYEALIGERPFRGDNAASVLSSIIKDSPPSVSDLNPSLPPVLSGVIRRCLAKDPERRYQSAKDVRNELEELKQELASGTKIEPGKAARHVGSFIAAGLATVTVAIGLYALLSPAPRDPTLSWEIKRLTTFAGREGGPTWSPDGSFFAYNGEALGSMDLFVMSTSGGDPIRLTDTPYDELTPRWSPNGRHLAFVSNRGSGLDVYLMPPLGGAERKLAETRIQSLERIFDALMALGAVPWSPDGQKLLFPAVHPGGDTAIWLVDVTSGERSRVTEPPPGSYDLSASWSFDGESIVFQRHRGGIASLWLTHPQGGEPRPLLSDEYNNIQPSWSADSRRVAFISNRAGHDNLWDIEISSARLRQLTVGPGSMLRYTVAARDGPLAYATFTHETDLYLHSIEKATDERLTFHRSNNFDARFSPGGDRIVYQSDRTGNPEIWSIDLATHREKQLTEHPATDIVPDWSPDEREIVFLSNRDGEFHLWVMDRDGGVPRRLTDDAIPLPGIPTGIRNYSLAMRWSPDGEAIGVTAQVEEGRALWVVDRNGKNPRTRLPGAHSFDWYRDSRHVVYIRPGAGGVLELLAADLETGKETLLRREILTEIDVAPDGRSLVYLHAESHWNQDVYRLQLLPPAAPGELPRAVGDPEQLTFGGNQSHAHGGSWSPDGRSIVFTRDADEGDVYFIKNYRD